MTVIDGNSLEGALDLAGWIASTQKAESSSPPGGLLMYLDPALVQPAHAQGLLLDRALPDPAMPFAITADEALALADQTPGVRAAPDVPPAPAEHDRAGLRLSHLAGTLGMDD
jgi:hypothetical protein